MAAKISRKVLIIIISSVIVLGTGIGVLVGILLSPKAPVLKIYNWEDYMSVGLDESVDLIKQFETEYRLSSGQEDFTVQYDTFSDNEELYTKIKMNKADYDIAFPSEYMVEKMRDENLLNKINKTEISNYAGLDASILTMAEGFSEVTGDSNSLWSIPYVYGTLGIMWDADVIAAMEPETGISVDEFKEILKAEGFGVLFGANNAVYGDTSQYKGRITMKKSARDTIGIAMLHANNSHTDGTVTQDDIQDMLNMNGAYSIDQAEATLNAQITTMAPYYENDAGKLAMADPEDQRFAYGLYWNCDAGLIMGEGLDNINFYTPEKTNLWVDNFVMPKYGKNSEAAHAFIDFMLDAENAYNNMDYVGSAMPVTQATTDLQADYTADVEYDWTNYLATMFPTGSLTHSAIMANFDSVKETAVNDLMVSVISRAASEAEQNNNDNESGNLLWLWVTLGVVLVGGGAYLAYWLPRRRRR